jgi:YesN/AraC family two-component response regulator
MKLLLVDDEIVSIKGIQKGIDWNLMPFEKVFTATSAAAAREIMKKEKIDIILCDIEMPGESGLKLLEWIRTEKINTECIFLTCHEEFQFARKALQLQGMDYLLKPIPYDELMDILLKAVETIFEKNQVSRYLEYGKQQLSSMEKKELGKCENITDIQKLIVKVKKYTWEHLQEELSAEILAKQVYISADYLYRIFKKHEGITPSEYITNAKMLYASEVLKNPKIGISHAAVLSGYSNYCYFTKIFKKFYGVTPSQYKRLHGEKRTERARL